ncbi:MAG: Rab family GTPase [Candidatus Thorarchaeota archaeon]
MAYKEPDFVHKLVFLGNSGVGKTSLVERYVYDSFNPNTVHTIGAILHVKYVEIEDITHKLIIWDLGGQESFAQLREQYCSNAAGAFFVFDRTRPETFHSLGEWLDALYAGNKDAHAIVVENKIDLEPKIGPDEIHSELAKRVLRFIQTSATENTNVDTAFTELVREIMRNL